jgi:hypothetical protein
MKKIAVCFLFLIAYFSSSVAMAAECTDLNGAWRGQLGELTVGLNINISGSSSVDYKIAGGGGGMVGGVGSTCQIKEGVPNIWIWHQVGNDRGTDWYIRVIVDGNLNNPNELTIKTFKYLSRSGKSGSGSGILYK